MNLNYFRDLHIYRHPSLVFSIKLRIDTCEYIISCWFYLSIQTFHCRIEIDKTIRRILGRLIRSTTNYLKISTKSTRPSEKTNLESVSSLYTRPLNMHPDRIWCPICLCPFDDRREKGWAETKRRAVAYWRIISTPSKWRYGFYDSWRLSMNSDGLKDVWIPRYLYVVLGVVYAYIVPVG